MDPIKAKAFSLLAKRSYFSKELRDKLLEKQYPRLEVEVVITSLMQGGWIDDQELGKRFVERLKNRGYGAKVIVHKLRLKAGELNLGIEDSDLEVRRLIEKRYLKDLPDKKDRVVRSLLRRGFSYEKICSVLKEFFDLI